MKKKNRIWICQFLILLIVIIAISGCENDEDATIKEDPSITWENPADIIVGTLLSNTQLNATADVAGTFVYTPGIGTNLDVGDNQDLKVDFTPDDIATYNLASKTVQINVLESSGDGGISTAVFNPNLTYGEMTDQDGNTYKTISIGTGKAAQTWMAENLRVTSYRNGDPIPYVNNTNQWEDLTTGAQCTYNNTDDINYIATYGRLYNWYAVVDSRNIERKLVT